MQKRLYAILPLLLIIMLLYFGCTKADTLSSHEAPMQVTMSVLGYEGEVILAPTGVGLYPDETVLDVLVRASRENDILLDYSSSGATAYVKGIANLYEFDYGAQSGWIYTVESYKGTPGVSCGAFSLADGDSVEWVYIVSQR